MNIELRDEKSAPVQVTATTTRLTVPSTLIMKSNNFASNNSLVEMDNSVPWLLNAIRGKPLVVSLVGLPGRGKTIISNKLKRFLSWNKIRCEVFHLSTYRRQIAPDFPEHVINEPLKIREKELREKCFKMLFEDIASFFSGLKQSYAVRKTSTCLRVPLDGPTHNDDKDKGDVVIFDFANTRRFALVKALMASLLLPTDVKEG